MTNARHGTLYGFRVWGENWPYTPEWTPGSTAGFVSDRDADLNHFNPNKVLFDPYAREVTHTPLSLGPDSELLGSGPVECRGKPGRAWDTASVAPKGVVIEDSTPYGDHPQHPEENNSIYEAHVKNLTMHPNSVRLADLLAGVPGFEEVENVPDALRGTYAGAALMAPYLKALGVSVIELLPVHETDSDQRGDQAGTTNHWGYQTLAFFAPNRDYSSDQSLGGPTREFKEMVRAFHAADIEVFLDVVYNHSAEGGNWGGDLDAAGFTTLGGFATTEYYALTAGGGLIDGATGTSNQMNFSSRITSRLVLDSLRHWHDTMGVDGFRFDLAPVLGRRPNAAEAEDWEAQRRFFSNHPLLDAVAKLAEEKTFEVIAEAWDLWGYEVGNFPSGWGEWNGRFRDAMRAYLKGDGNTDDFMSFFNGDYLHFNDNAGPQKSINFVTAHDGFTMFDLVSYNAKNNDQPYPFGPSDGGSDNNLSWDSGGDQALRRTRWRNLWLITFLARGVPMIVSGDEYGRTQNGNNNPWSLNTVGIWNNWAQAGSNTPTRLPVDPAQPALPGYHDVVGQTATPEGINPLLVFARYVARLRAAQPTLRQRSWGDLSLGGDDVSYVYFGTDLDDPPRPGDRQLAVAIDAGNCGGDDFWVLINMYDQPATFDLGEWVEASGSKHDWHRIVDTHSWAEPEGNCWDLADALHVTGEYTVEPWSIVVLQASRPGLPEPEPRSLWGRLGGLQVNRWGELYRRGRADARLKRKERKKPKATKAEQAGPDGSA
ncbi:MAG: alpha-amylase family glycosyl hydrolase [Propioniciclava sp.]|uniref:alpha-amylase family glycosyl hydrolase n=1 Tax=Propioniciclava sp. TaxID=2038686 RepID=UPI0039E71AC2